MASNLLRGSVKASVTTRGKIQVTHFRDPDEVFPSNVVDSQFPEFIREEYPKIVDFAKAYYNYISGNTGIGNIYDMRDLDETTGQFIESLKKEYAYNTPRFSFLNDVEFIRAASKFYSSKGSEESYKFLFRIMFNDDVDIMYPSEQIFKPSTAKWVQQQSVKVSLLNGSVPATDFIGDFLTVRNAANKSQLILVDDAVSISEFDNEFEILFHTELVIDVNVDDVLVGENFLAKIIPTLESAVPLIPGKKFKVGQIIRFTTTTGSGGVGVVTVVDNNSGIKHIKMLQFGTAYLTNFYLSVAPDGVFTETTGSYVAGSGPSTADIHTVAQDATEGYLEEGDILRTDYVLNDSPGAYPNYAEPGYHGTYVSEFNIRQVFVLDDDYSALLICKVGAVAKYPGKHIDMTGFPSNASVLQDNNYYQDFSYVVKNKRNIKDYRDVMTNMVHPSGMKMFGEKSENLVFDTTSALMASTVAGTNDLNYNFRASAAASVEHYSMMLDFTRTSTLDSKITFSRTGTAASYYDETSVVKAEENLLTYSQDFNNAIWTYGFGSTKGAAVSAPDGTTSGISLTYSASNSSSLYHSVAGAFDGIYTISVYARSTTSKKFRFVFYSAAQQRSADITTTSTWTRYSFTSTSLTTLINVGFENESAGLAGVVEFWGGQLELRGVLTGYTPTTAATITNYIRPLQYAAANVARIDYDPTVISQQNLLTYSEQFGNASWGTNFLSSIVSNAAYAPDGTLTADKIIANGGADPFVSKLTDYGSPLAGNTLTWSVWVWTDSGQPTTATLFIYDSLLADVGSLAITLTTKPVRYSITRNFLATTVSRNVTVRVDLQDSAVNGTYVYVWGAQLNTGATALPYLQTTTAAKTLYAPKGLLIEEQRTNLLTYSEQFDNAVWAKTGSTIAANTIIAPDGTLTGDKLVESSGLSLHEANQISTTGISTDTYIAVSIYVKAAGRNYCYVRSNGNSKRMAIVVNLINGTFNVTNYANTLNTSGFVTFCGNGWYKISVTSQSNYPVNPGWTCNLTASPLDSYVSADSVAATGYTYTGDGYSGIYIWGAQLEAGAFPTSYIPTVASQVTRGADSAIMTGTNFSSWWNPTEGTLLTESDVIPYNASLSGALQIVSAYTSTTDNFGIRFDNGGTNMGATMISSGLNQTTINVAPGANQGYIKAAHAFSENTRSFYTTAGSATGTYTAVPTNSVLGIGNLNYGSYLNGYIKKIVYYPNRLSNARLQALTT